MNCRRVQKELRSIQNNPSEDWSVVPIKNSGLEWSVEFKPTVGPFAGLVISGIIAFPTGYPFSPPRPRSINFHTRVFHPVFPNPCSRDERRELAKLIADLRNEHIVIPTTLIKFEVKTWEGDNFTVEMGENETVISFMEKMEIEHDLLFECTTYIHKGKRISP
eukprot:CAMPEP_0194203560 /NCGR_PEP_ID=MMETSP0156-20130528/3300_1 /TAXON_ID=33649 /ORGANISM="Thalassionema nitzschioides, Strain L26-B" /LENGTH=162 /DNA_ID=CAMNT_0038929333 /DNA_START=108 /DNA_END=592 /DNA_ORIENTATION=-